MKNIVLISILLIFSVSEGYSQNVNTVVITTIGSGSNFENAKVNALRSALEQVSGAYLSANTLIINDKLISDNISTITTGSINKYEVLGQIVTNNQVFVTIKSEILPNKFADFVTGKTGSSVTVKGGLYAANIKQLNLNEKAELEAVKKLSDLYNDVLYKSLYYELKAKPIIEKNVELDHNTSTFYILPLIVTMRFTNLSDSINDFLKLNLKQICLSKSEIEVYMNIERKMYPICLDYFEYYFRNKSSPISLLKFDKRKSQIDYLNAYSIKLGQKTYYRYIDMENKSNYTFPGIQNLFVDDTSNFQNVNTKTIKGFISSIADDSFDSEWLNFYNYSLKYSPESTGNIDVGYKRDLCVQLWDKYSRINMLVDGYFTLSEIENIENIEIIKNKNSLVEVNY